MVYFQTEIHSRLFFCYIYELEMGLIVRIDELFSQSSFVFITCRLYYHLTFIALHIDYQRYGELTVHINKRFSDSVVHIM
jgi:hypothetical protein